MASPRLVVVRHAETAWSLAGRHTGRSDIELTDAGRRAALLARPLVAAEAPASACTSPLRRAQDTAELLGFPEARPLPDLMEWDYGDYEGRTRAEILDERPGWSVWADGAPGGEGPADVARRADAAIAAALEMPQPVLVVAHGHLLRVLAARWVGMEAAAGAHLALDPVGVGLLGEDRGTRVLARWNQRAAMGTP